MGIKLRIAIRNTFRHKRRTLLNLIMIASGVVAVILSRGFFSQHAVYVAREDNRDVERSSGIGG